MKSMTSCLLAQIKIASGGDVSPAYDTLGVREYTFEEVKAVADVAKT